MFCFFFFPGSAPSRVETVRISRDGGEVIFGFFFFFFLIRVRTRLKYSYCYNIHGGDIIRTYMTETFLKSGTVPVRPRTAVVIRSRLSLSTPQCLGLRTEYQFGKPLSRTRPI